MFRDHAFMFLLKFVMIRALLARLRERKALSRSLPMTCPWCACAGHRGASAGVRTPGHVRPPVAFDHLSFRLAAVALHDGNSMLRSRPRDPELLRDHRRPETGLECREDQLSCSGVAVAALSGSFGFARAAFAGVGLADHSATDALSGAPCPRRRPSSVTVSATRFLSREEIGRSYRGLDEHAGRGNENRKQADIVHLLLLTGCRKGKIVGLRWSEVRGDTLELADSKTGPRKVPLNSQARCILDRQSRGQSLFVFPSPLDASRPRGDRLRLWYRVRREAGIEDVRLHDLRHTLASHAVMNGALVPVVSRLLGHSNGRMTLRYAHLGDREIEDATERVGQAIAAIIDLENE